MAELSTSDPGECTSIAELAKTVLGLVLQGPGLVSGEARPGDVMHSCADIGKTRKVLGYSPRIELLEGLKTLIQSDAKNLMV